MYTKENTYRKYINKYTTGLLIRARSVSFSSYQPKSLIEFIVQANLSVEKFRINKVK